MGGGLSIIGSLFAEDIISSQDQDFSFYIVRIIVGFTVLVIGYGIIEKERREIWLYGGLALVAVFTNPLISVVPIGVVLYLFIKRQLFKPSLADQLIDILIFKIKALIYRNAPPS